MSTGDLGTSAGPPAASPRRTALAVIAVAALAVLAYLTAIPNGFVIDDRYQVVENPWIEGPAHLGDVFGSGVWDFEGRVSSYYRPLMFVHYMAVAALAGRTAWAFHLANVLLHACVTGLVYLVAQRAFSSKSRDAPWLAITTAALFAVHPIHSEAVAWIAAVVELGCTLFVLLAVWTYDRGRTGHRIWLVLSGACVLVALLFKETGVSAIPILLAWEWWIGGRSTRSPGRMAVAAASTMAACAVYVSLRWLAFGAMFAPGERLAIGLGDHVRAAIALASMHVEKLVAPVGLNVWHVFEPPVSWISRGTVRALAVLGGAAAFTTWLVRGSRVARFAAVVSVVPLLPTFHFAALNTGIAGAFAERYLYLPSLGFLMLVAIALGKLRAREPREHVVATAIVVALVSVGGAVTLVRNTQWKDSLTIWRDAVGKSPESGVALFNYGAALRFRGFDEEGDAAIRRAVVLAPELVGREMAKGRAYLDRGLVKKAMLAFHLALHLEPGNADAHFGLGLTYEANGWTDAARGEYDKAIVARPEFAEAHNNLGILLASQGRLDLALPHFEEAVRLRPDDPDYRANLRRARGLAP